MNVFQWVFTHSPLPRTPSKFLKRHLFVAEKVETHWYPPAPGAPSSSHGLRVGVAHSQRRFCSPKGSSFLLRPLDPRLMRRSHLSVLTFHSPLLRETVPLSSPLPKDMLKLGRSFFLPSGGEQTTLGENSDIPLLSEGGFSPGPSLNGSFP